MIKNSKKLRILFSAGTIFRENIVFGCCPGCVRYLKPGNKSFLSVIKCFVYKKVLQTVVSKNSRIESNPYFDKGCGLNHPPCL